MNRLTGGLYAIFTHKGPAAELHPLYRAVHNYWLPKSKYRAQNTESYAIYLNNPQFVTATEQLTEIYIPLMEK